MHDTCQVFHRILVAKQVPSDENSAVVVSSSDCLAIVATASDTYLKDPVTRSQGLDDFATTIADAVNVMESLDSWFGSGLSSGGLNTSTVESNSPEYFHKTMMESSIRLRGACIYAAVSSGRLSSNARPYLA